MQEIEPLEAHSVAPHDGFMDGLLKRLALFSTAFVTILSGLTVLGPTFTAGAAVNPAPLLTLYAGTGTSGVPTPGPATNSKLSNPRGIAIDSLGNLYIADTGDSVIEKVTPTGVLSIIAGTGISGTPVPGPAASSPLGHPAGMATDASGNLYIADTGYSAIEKITPDGVLSIVAGTGTRGAEVPGPATSSPLGVPTGVAVDGTGNLYIADYLNVVVAKVTPLGMLSVVAGNGAFGTPVAGPATATPLGNPRGIALDGSGNLFIADSGYGVVEKVTPGGTLSVIAGTGIRGTPTPGIATNSKLNNPYALTTDAQGNLYIADSDNHVIEEVSTGGTLSIFAGTGIYGTPTPGTATGSRFASPNGLALDASGNLFIADYDSAVVANITLSGVLIGNLPQSGSVGGSFSPSVASTGDGTTSVTSATPGICSVAGSTVNFIAAGTCNLVSHVASGPNYAGADGAMQSFTIARGTPSVLLSIIAGTGTKGTTTPGPATSATLGGPNGVAVDASGNLYIADFSNHIVQKVTPSGLLSIVAGNGTQGAPTPGPATSSMLSNSQSIAVDASGNLYIADADNAVIEKVTPGGVLSIVAGTGSPGTPTAGSATRSMLRYPADVTVDSAGNLYIADYSNYVIEKVTPAGDLSIVAGTGNYGAPTPGAATSSRLNGPSGVAVDASGNLYIADSGNALVEKVNPGGVLSIVAGNGTSGAPSQGVAIGSSLGYPEAVTVDASGNLYIADFFNHVIEKVTLSGSLSIIAGTGTEGPPTPGPVGNSMLSGPNGLAVDATGNLYIADYDNAVVEKITPAVSIRNLPMTGSVGDSFTPAIATTGDGATSVVSTTSGTCSVTGTTVNYVSVGTCTLIARVASGTNYTSAEGSNQSFTIARGMPPLLLSVVVGNGAAGAPTQGTATSSKLKNPRGVVADGSGNLYIADTDNNVIEKATPSGVLSVVAGTGTAGSPVPGPATASKLNGPNGVAIDTAGNLYIADSGNALVERVTPSGVLSVVAGTGTAGAPTPGAATSSKLNDPSGIALDTSGNLYIADADAHVIEKVSPTGVLSIYAGTGSYGAPTAGAATSSTLCYPTGVAIDGWGNLFIADADAHVIEKVTPSGVLSVVAGTGATGAPTPGTATNSKLSVPNGVATDALSNLYIADSDNHVVEKVSPSGVLSIYAGTGSYGAPTSGIATASKLSYPSGVGADPAGNLFIADADGNVIEKITATVFISNMPKAGIVGASFASTFATSGDGLTSITSSTPVVCSVAGLNVSYLAPGTCTLIAHVGQGTRFTATNGVPQSLTVQGFSIVPVTLPRATRGRTFGPVALHATGIVPSTSASKVTISWMPVALPLGLKISPSGVLSGVVNVHLAPGTRAVKVKAIETMKTRVGGVLKVTTSAVQATFMLTIR